MKSSRQCLKCGTEWASRSNDCPFCGAHHHGRPGKICSCGEYVATAAEERERERYEWEMEQRDLDWIPSL